MGRCGVVWCPFGLLLAATPLVGNESTRWLAVSDRARSRVVVLVVVCAFVCGGPFCRSGLVGLGWVCFWKGS